MANAISSPTWEATESAPGRPQSPGGTSIDYPPPPEHLPPPPPRAVPFGPIDPDHPERAFSYSSQHSHKQATGAKNRPFHNRRKNDTRVAVEKVAQKGPANVPRPPPIHPKRSQAGPNLVSGSVRTRLEEVKVKLVKKLQRLEGNQGSKQFMLGSAVRSESAVRSGEP